MRRKWNMRFRQECEHSHTVVITSVGVRRIVCESCGHISFRMAPGIATTQPNTERAKLPKASGL